MPIAVLRPAAGVSEAISYTLLGLRNQLDPNSRVDEEDEWNADHSMFLGTDNTNSSRQNRDKNKNLYASFLNNSGKK
jgi:hypothetical protein